MTFAEKLIAAVKTAEAGTETDFGKPFRDVLDQFVAALSQLGIGARLDRLGDPRRLGVWMYPLHRPSWGSIMLTAFFEGEAVIVSDGTPTKLTRPDLLEAWLVDFVKQPAFMESRDILRQKATLPVEAQLRVNRDGGPHVQDVVVAVGSADQEVLDAAAVNRPAGLYVERIEFPGNPPLMAEPSYALLDSAGLVVSISHSKLQQGKLYIMGTRTQ